MEPQYRHQDHELEIYKLWEASGAFSPSVTKGKKPKPYSIIMPPPNANDPLHIGHAMFVAIEDILIRWRRMQGYATLWLPGTDHAGIETQFVFEKKLQEQGKSRFDFDRESLYRMIWDYVQENSGIAVAQMKILGASADWSRFRFTLDEKILPLVISTFENLHQDGLVYRDLQLVNFCTQCGTAFSDLEVKHVKRKTPLYYLTYGPFTLATVRPETKFGDTGVAVHPKDSRYRKWVGKSISVQGLLGRFKISVVADPAVDPDFGTGVVKVTPAHDPNDFALWQRHKDSIPGPKQVIGFDGKLNVLAGRYAGLSVPEARRAVVRDLKKEGLLVREDPSYRHVIGVCYRCGNPLEPLPLPQFFIRVSSLTQRALEALRKKRVRIHGPGYDKILRHWLTSLRDWNVSRQIVWGIRLPVWYQIGKGQNMIVKFLDNKKQLREGEVGELLKTHSLVEIREGLQELRAAVDAEYVVSTAPPGDDYLQETDTFDTWFSSAQWPFVTLRASHPGDFARFYPTDVMETGYDILPFWVMRMLLMGLYQTGEVPFRDVYLHGLIRDERGQKMSKSRGNVINPLNVVERYGADALRMALVIRSTAGQDKSIGEADFLAMRNLTNKIWNAARYVISQISNDQLQISTQLTSSNDQQFKQHLEAVVGKVTKQLESFRIGLAAETVYNEFWHWFCDRCIEETKHGRLSAKALLEGFVVFLKLFQPFIPFVSETIYQELRKAHPGVAANLLRHELLMTSDWPSSKSAQKASVSKKSVRSKSPRA